MNRGFFVHGNDQVRWYSCALVYTLSKGIYSGGLWNKDLDVRGKVYLVNGTCLGNDKSNVRDYRPKVSR
ncbi:MAG: hypothetical protein MJY98_08425 [Fibrobacter sp.]|nr:hypothetical protein [Fibrobacter sp.]